VAGRLLPDSNAFIALMRGDEGVVEIFDAAPEIVLSVVVLGELAYGAMNSRSVEGNLAKLAEVAAPCRLAPVDEQVAQAYARVRLALKRKGRPIPENDIWIAATALSVGADVLTDDAHFHEVEGLVLQALPSP
jgi:tRNA(fMet)-specific endonuclease VapC